ncbi:hypothetical protein CTA2_8023 [Colletotrichum tanaceti]|uniref:Glyoxalase-like domain-containing protein n=1 Tax=Colletotrichum tanaceti TaxID=1306861 RepID=A0A4U6XQN6_9PEZI|nr:hypothetical protein CTA2_8023 [Colletotrichum tanaceti]TKW58101.1 hypothetical protein CTA1_11129 [Colletotrichum tanaceti]
MAPSYDQSSPLLDHIVILLPHQVLASLPSWISSEFTILTGGRHADGRTENKLVILADGTYLELISFVEGLGDEERLEHKWGPKPDGTVIDWAYSLEEESGFAAIQERVRKAQPVAVYDDPVLGGRIRPDGTELKWAVALPAGAGAGAGTASDGAVERGELPFWCFDRTPRELRVPNHVAENTRHPSGALGVCSLAVDVGREELKRAYAGINGRAGEGDDGGRWAFDVPVRQFDDPRHLLVETVPGGRGPSIRLSLYTAAGTPRRTIAGDLGGGVSVAIDLVPVSGGSS